MKSDSICIKTSQTISGTDYCPKCGDSKNCSEGREFFGDEIKTNGLIGIKDLRIGNIVHLTLIGAYEIKPTDIHPDKMQLYSPIAIDEEILKGCKFHQKMAQVETWWLDDITLHLDSCWWWNADMNNDDSGSSSRRVDTLHDLQNIYKVIHGKELEIDFSYIKRYVPK